MRELLVTKGLPASGKTTFARKWVAEDVKQRCRLNRDDLRAMMHDSVFDHGSTESAILYVRDVALNKLLSVGRSVIIDDTNLSVNAVFDIKRIAKEFLLPIRWVDFTHISWRECLRRNHARKERGERSVEPVVIFDMWHHYIDGRESCKVCSPGWKGPACCHACADRSHSTNEHDFTRDMLEQ